jgi:hypothetical protein
MQRHNKIHVNKWKKVRKWWKEETKYMSVKQIRHCLYNNPFNDYYTHNMSLMLCYMSWCILEECFLLNFNDSPTSIQN